MTSLIREVWMVAMTSMWLFCCLQYFLPFLLFLPFALVPGVGTLLYRKLHGLYDQFGVVCTMTVPFSWCGLRVHIKGYDAFRQLDGSDALILATHCSRIDWLIGAFLCVIRNHRVGFVAEATTALMPIVGWQRFLGGDIFVTRAFHKDAPRIEANIASYKASGIRRAIFLAPEGFVADPGSAVGDAYLPQCDEFMAREGRAPLTHLLTPRYKGMQAFVQHAPSNIISCAMAYVEDVAMDSATGRLVGGRLCSRGLRDAERTIPDLHSVFRGGLGVLIQGGRLAALDNGSDPQQLKKQMLDDQELKDRMLRHLEATGTFLADESIPPGYYAERQSPYEEIAVPHLWLNLCMALHTAASVAAVALVFRISMLVACGVIANTVGVIALLHVSTHYGARLITGSASMESLIGETAIKAILRFCLGVAKALRNAARPTRSKKAA